MTKIYNDPLTNKITADDNGRIAWSSDFPPVNLLSADYWQNITQDISFPDFTKFANYAYQRIYDPDGDGGTPWSLSASGDACQTVTMIAPENTQLEDIILGTVPSSVNYLDVRVRLTRTKAPNQFLDQTVPPLIEPTEWVHLPGGSCLIEATTIWRRLFEISLSGTNILLRRKQSVAPIPAGAVSSYGGIYSTIGNGVNPFTTASFDVWGWVPNAGAGFARTQRDGHPAALIDVKQFGGNPGASVPTMGAKHPARERACSVNVAVHDFSSVYSAEIQIRPGYIAP